MVVYDGNAVNMEAIAAALRGATGEVRAGNGILHLLNGHRTRRYA